MCRNGPHSRPTGKRNRDVIEKESATKPTTKKYGQFSSGIEEPTAAGQSIADADAMNGGGDRIPSSAELPVVIYAPYGNDGRTLHAVLTDAGFTPVIANDLAQLRTSLAREAGLLVISQEGLTENSLGLIGYITGQAPSRGRGTMRRASRRQGQCSAPPA
ncbi:hypothetical protein [Aurantimonas marina]|uniref:hypothetical protein n=1 Tax=Aurantimonas marina TaxID=2780508 RepID=UPI0019D11AB2|nr:hypothetical protein [Aurantimonas marina]